MQLAHDVSSGVEVPFELVDASGGQGQPLWCHRTQSAEFIRQRLGVLGMLPGYAVAAETLERIEGLDEWLLSRGEQHVPANDQARADATLRVFLAAVLGDTSTFEFEPDRFEAPWGTLDALLFEGCTATLLAAPLHGVELEADELRLADGTLLVTNRSLEAEALPADIFRGDGLPVVVAMVDVSDPGAEAISQARQQLRKLLCSLRMFGDVSPALGGAARMQVSRGPWQVVSLEGSGSARGSLVINRGDETEFADFHAMVSRRWPRGGEIAWALRRHEFGCDRLYYLDGLSDHLMGLRALLEPEGPASGRLGQRLAVLCAIPADQARLAERTARAVALEHCAVSGLSAHEPEAEQLCHEIQQHLRSLVRDVICSHLDSDLCGKADSMLADAAGVESLPDSDRSTRRTDRSTVRGWNDPDSLAA